MAANQRPKAKDLPCVFATFFEKYEGVGLLEYETKKSQTKRYMNSEKSKSRLQLCHTFFSELVQIQMHLEEYSLCEIHYNQLIASDFLR